MEDFLSRLLAKFSRRVFWLVRELLNWAYWPIRATQRLTLFLFDFIIGWWRSRELRRLIPGLPAVLIAIAATYVALASAFQDRGQILQAYQRAAKSAMAAENYASAKLYLERIITMQGGDNETLFDLALAAQKTKDYPRVAASMQSLAPLDRPVHAPAHIWQAAYHINLRPTTLKDLQIAETHLLHALKLRPQDALGNDLLGQLYFQQGLYGQAIRYLLISAQSTPTRKLTLAKAYALSGERSQALRYGTEARDYYARESAAKPQDVSLRVSWADACLFIDDFSEAVRLLRETLAMHDEQSVRQALVRCLVAWADDLPTATVEQRQEQFELLEKGVQIYPNELLLFDRLMRLLDRDDETSRAARELLQANIVAGKAIGLSHLLLGSYAFKSAGNDEATFHLERAFESLPNADLIANNLAWTLAFSDPPQVDRALSLIQPVVERNASSPRFRDTRGHILLKLDRPKDALPDLEFALKSLSGNSQTHLAIAECYEKLGIAELAAKHRAVAMKLEQSTSAPVKK